MAAASAVTCSSSPAAATAERILATQPSTLQLRYLQTLTEIGVEKNTTIVFPLPIDIISGLAKVLNKE